MGKKRNCLRSKLPVFAGAALIAAAGAGVAHYIKGNASAMGSEAIETSLSNRYHARPNGDLGIFDEIGLIGFDRIDMHHVRGSYATNNMGSWGGGVDYILQPAVEYSSNGTAKKLKMYGYASQTIKAPNFKRFRIEKEDGGYTYKTLSSIENAELGFGKGIDVNIDLWNGNGEMITVSYDDDDEMDDYKIDYMEAHTWTKCLYRCTTAGNTRGLGAENIQNTRILWEKEDDSVPYLDLDEVKEQAVALSNRLTTHGEDNAYVETDNGSPNTADIYVKDSTMAAIANIKPCAAAPGESDISDINIRNRGEKAVTINVNLADCMEEVPRFTTHDTAATKDLPIVWNYYNAPGDITININGMHGMILAPNYDIELGSDQTFTGSIVANSIKNQNSDLVAGESFGFYPKMIEDPRIIPEHHVWVTHCYTKATSAPYTCDEVIEGPGAWDYSADGIHPSTDVTTWDVAVEASFGGASEYITSVIDENVVSSSKNGLRMTGDTGRFEDIHITSYYKNTRKYNITVYPLREVVGQNDQSLNDEGFPGYTYARGFEEPIVTQVNANGTFEIEPDFLGIADGEPSTEIYTGQFSADTLGNADQVVDGNNHYTLTIPDVGSDVTIGLFYEESGESSGIPTITVNYCVVSTGGSNPTCGRQLKLTRFEADDSEREDHEYVFNIPTESFDGYNLYAVQDGGATNSNVFSTEHYINLDNGDNFYPAYNVYYTPTKQMKAKIHVVEYAGTQSRDVETIEEPVTLGESYTISVPTYNSAAFVGYGEGANLTQVNNGVLTGVATSEEDPEVTLVYRRTAYDAAEHYVTLKYCDYDSHMNTHGACTEVVDSEQFPIIDGKYDIAPGAIEGYRYIENPAIELSGESDTDTEIRVYYRKLYTITIKSVDENGKEIAEPRIEEYFIGDDYSIEPIDFDGYVYDSFESSVSNKGMSGEINQDMVITLSYKTDESHKAADNPDTNDGIAKIASILGGASFLAGIVAFAFNRRRH